MKRNFLAFLCTVLPSFAYAASNEGVPVYYTDPGRPNANQVGYGRYQNYGYTQYVGTSGKKQIIGSNQYTYQVPHQSTTYVDVQKVSQNPQQNAAQLYMQITQDVSLISNSKLVLILSLNGMICFLMNLMSD